MHILQVTLYSKLVAELSRVSENNINIRYLFIAFLIYKIFTTPYFVEPFQNFCEKWQRSKDESVLIIPQHKRIFTTYTGNQTRESVQQLYSDRFRALNYYLSKHLPSNINKMVEISRRESKSIWETETIDYILLPIQEEKILIDPENDIYFEIFIKEENKDSDEKKQKDVTSYKNYTYKLTKRGKNQFHVLEKFIENSVAEYKNEILNKKQQSVFEYLKYKKDDDDNCEMVFYKYPFRSNKYLDKNIFFEGKVEFIKYVDRFVKKSDPDEKSPAEQQYEDAGITFKSGIMMIGPPGCGKSSTIRGILNRTKRHGILVRWSSLNTCSEFTALLRSTKINGVKYEPGELCFIFEDFDANNDEILKCRTTKTDSISIEQEKLSNLAMNDFSSEESADDIKQELLKTKKTMETMILLQNQKKEDALTLECVLNTIDGIMELHDVMLIFTTNHLEKIDPAFIRPGRIDYILKLDLASVCVIKEMIAHKYRNECLDIDQYQSYFDRINGSVISPADIQMTCLKYGPGEIENCLEELIKKTVVHL